jgi:hypothetical protein
MAHLVLVLDIHFILSRQLLYHRQPGYASAPTNSGNDRRPIIIISYLATNLKKKLKTLILSPFDFFVNLPYTIFL